MELHDGAITLVAVVGFFIPVCTSLVALRLWVRWRHSRIRMDDWLLIVGLVLFLPSIAVVIPAAQHGLGMHEHHYDVSEFSHALKYFFVFQVLCLPALAFIRSSLCVTLTGFTQDRRLLAFLYFLIALSVFSCGGALVFILAMCRPVSAQWMPPSDGGGSCWSPEAMVVMAKIFSASGMIVVISVSLLPVGMLWRVKMKWRLKMSVMLLMGLGIVAACATLVRVPLLHYMTDKRDFLFGLGQITLWAFTEVAISIIAGALSSLRPLLRWFFDPETLEGGPGHHHQDQAGLTTFRASPWVFDSWETTGDPQGSIGMCTTVNAGGADAESQRSIIGSGDIKVRQSITVESGEETEVRESIGSES